MLKIQFKLYKPFLFFFKEVIFILHLDWRLWKNFKIDNSLLKSKEDFQTETINNDWVTHVTSNRDIFNVEVWSSQTELKINTAPV